jgi:hypothetical protein
MGIGTSLLLIAVGAILHWAVSAHVNGIDLQAVGLILLVVGVIGLVISFLWMAMWSDRQRQPAAYPRDGGAYPPDRDRY